MTKSVLTTLSLSFFTLAAATASPATAQGVPMGFASAPMESPRPGCSTQAEIDLGWEYQHQVFESRLAARSAEGLKVPGAIIVPPFPSFAPYRAEVPSAVVAGRSARPSSRVSRSRGMAGNKS